MGRIRNILRAGKITRLYAGEVNASAMGLKETADRLTILRRTLMRQKDHSDTGKLDMNLWAFRKLRETKEALREELKDINQNKETHPQEQSSENWNGLMKIISAGIGLTVIGDAWHKMNNLFYTRSKALVVAGLAVIGVLALFHISNKLVSSSLDESFHRLNDLINSLSASFARKLPDHVLVRVKGDDKQVK